MANTIKIQRPKFPRRPDGAGGRVQHDSRGNAVWTRTRADDSADLPDTSGLAVVEDAPDSLPAGRPTSGGRPVRR